MLQYGDTALHEAAAGGEVEVVNLLVNHGAAVDIRNKVDIYCTHRESTCTLEVGQKIRLCRQRMIVIDVFILQYGDTALHQAAARGRVAVVKALVDYGAAVDIRNEVQWNPSNPPP
jgi:ankyrin repeat protein